MKFFALSMLALGASATHIQSRALNLSKDVDVGEAMNEIGEFINDHVDEYGKFQIDDAIGVCTHIAKEHDYTHCPKPVVAALKEAFKYCDANGDGYVTPAEFHKCYNE